MSCSMDDMKFTEDKPMITASEKALTNELNKIHNGLAWLGLAWRSARALEVYPFLEPNID